MSDSLVEAEVRVQINRRLEVQGWNLDSDSNSQDVFLERAVLRHLSITHRNRLGPMSPDYTLFCNGAAIAILEAKKPSTSIQVALDQATDYARKIEVDYVFACNGPVFKTFHIPTGKNLRLNGVEVTDPISPALLSRFWQGKACELNTVPEDVIKSREQLIQVFQKINETLRRAGLRAGLDRFSEFANLLFLKLLGEREEAKEIWDELKRKPEEELVDYLNGYAIKKIYKDFGGNVSLETSIKDGKYLRQIINELSPLRLSSVDDDVKGMAFEYFLGNSASSSNDLGEYFTPREVVRFMVKALNPQLGSTVLDPFCGTGGFLIEAFKHLGSQATPSKKDYHQLHHNSLYGKEITKNARIAKMNMILFGDGHSGVEETDSMLPEGLGEQYDHVLSNIPFSLGLDKATIRKVDSRAKDSDGACFLRCFNSLRLGGAMAIVVPDGLVVNQKHKSMWRHVCNNAKIKFIASLPQGTFAPYTQAATKIILLTEKNLGKTERFYDVLLGDGEGRISFDEFGFFFQGDVGEDGLPGGVGIVEVQNLSDAGSFLLKKSWQVGCELRTVRLDEIANIKNGSIITESDSTPGPFPVIAGGRGSVPYTHNESNQEAQCLTISKSGAYAGYVWWHDSPIWASDCIVVRSLDETKFLTFYLYHCLRTKQQEIYSRQQGTGQPHIYKNHIEDFPIPDLSLAEQKEFVASGLSSLRKQLAAQKEAEEEESRISGLLRNAYRAGEHKAVVFRHKGMSTE